MRWRAGKSLCDEDGKSSCSGAQRNPIFTTCLSRLWIQKGKITEVIPQRVGFRRFQMKDSIMTLNGNELSSWAWS